MTPKAEDRIEDRTEDTPPTKGRCSLREGFTTGTAATAAAMAALELWLSGTAPTSVDVPLPPFEENAPTSFLSIPVERVWLREPDKTTSTEVSGMQASTSVIKASASVIKASASVIKASASVIKASASVIKDGGDDPDATHGARIVAAIALDEEPHEESKEGPSRIRILGGVGVGRVTLPGLPLPVGECAINPVPRQQIAHGLRLVAMRHGHSAPLHVTISVPEGETIARHTFNGRLGIVGGISILGTQGTVKPYSHAAWKATICQGLDVAAATHCTTLCLSTGRRSEKLLLGQYPHLPPQAAVQVADFAEFSLHEAGQRPFTELVWGCFFGKLVKLAQGHSYTHARSAELNFTLLARWCAEAGAEATCVSAVPHCVTASHALELLLTHHGEDKACEIVRGIALKAIAVAQNFINNPDIILRLHVFHLNGKELVRV